MVSTFRRSGWIMCVGLVSVLLGGGCIYRNVSCSQSGVYVDDQAFARITPGKTTAAWACSVMGEPSSKSKTGAGTEIWTWSGIDSKTVDAQFVIVKDNSTVSTHRKASIEIKDGIVIDKWLSSREVKDRDNGSL